MSLDIESVLTAEWGGMPAGTVGGEWQRERIAHVAAVLREQIAEWIEAEADAMPDLTEHSRPIRAAFRSLAEYARAAQVAPSRVGGDS